MTIKLITKNMLATVLDNYLVKLAGQLHHYPKFAIEDMIGEIHLNWVDNKKIQAIKNLREFSRCEYRRSYESYIFCNIPNKDLQSAIAAAGMTSENEWTFTVSDRAMGLKEAKDFIDFCWAIFTNDAERSN